MADESTAEVLTQEQYGRAFNLIVSNTDLEGIDLSALHVIFHTKMSDTATPNTAEIKVYNLARETAELIRNDFKRVTLQAGYESNQGVIFQGTIFQVIIGRENGTDTFVNLICADGDLGYNFAVVNQTIDAGATAEDQVNASVKAMSAKGDVDGKGYVAPLPTTQLPRGKVMFGAAKKYLTQVGKQALSNWSIQDGKVTFVKLTGYAPGEAVEVNAQTGMIGMPEQTNVGINVKILINPRIRVQGRIKLNNDDIQRMKINLNTNVATKNSISNLSNLTPAGLTADGVYYVLTIEYEGDNRGTPWYANLTCLNVAVTTNPANSLQVN